MYYSKLFTWADNFTAAVPGVELLERKKEAK